MQGHTHPSHSTLDATLRCTLKVPKIKARRAREAQRRKGADKTGSCKGENLGASQRVGGRVGHKAGYCTWSWSEGNVDDEEEEEFDREGAGLA